MKYIRAKKGQEVFWGEVSGDEVKALKKAPYLSQDYTGEVLKLSEVKLLAPCEPQTIVAVGKNYYSHAVEFGEGIPDHPIIFLKPLTVLCGPEDDVPYPETSKRVDFEGELAFIIGKTASCVKKEDAFDYIFGYTCMNDVTARDIQKLDGQWTRGKGFDKFGPVGPWLVTGIDPSDLKVETRLNGEVKQSSSTKMFMFDIPILMEVITDCMTLYPGDIITTGTPENVGPMQIGDTVEVEIEGIGVLRNRIVKR